MRTTQAEVVACVSVLKSERPWCFFSVGGLERAAPRWVLLDGFEAPPELDLSKVAAALRARLSDQVETRSRDDRSDFVIETFVSRLRDCEHELLPVRRRRALSLLDTVTSKWIEAARSSQRFDWHGELRELREWLCLSANERRVPFPDPGTIANPWLRVLRTRIRRALENRRNRRRPWRLDDLLPDRVADRVPVALIWRAFEGVLTLPPVDERIIALIAGVDSRPPADLPRPSKGRSFGSR